MISLFSAESSVGQRRTPSEEYKAKKKIKLKKNISTYFSHDGHPDDWI